MKFEYDDNKSNTNMKKHGIDFDEAKALWEDDNLLEVPLPFNEESRHLCVGKIYNKHYSAIITYRGKSIRLISVRRSRKEEITNYENS